MADKGTRQKLEAATIGVALRDTASARHVLARLNGYQFSDFRAGRYLDTIRDHLKTRGELDAKTVGAAVDIQFSFAYLADCQDLAAAMDEEALEELLQLEAEAPAPAPPALLTCSPYTQEEPMDLPEQVIPGIPRGAVSFLHGAEGAGKTALALQLAAALTSGTPWLNQPAQEAQPVLFIAQEMGGAELQARTRAICSRTGANLSSLRTLLAVVTEEELGGKYLDLRRDLGRLQATMKAMRTTLLVVDHLSALSADERDTGQHEVTETFRQLAMATGAAVLILDHDNKAGFTERGAHSGRALKRRAAAATLWLAEERGNPFLDVGKARYLSADDRGRVWLGWESLPDPWGRVRAGRPVTWGYLAPRERTPDHLTGPGRLQGLVELVGDTWTPTPDVLARLEAAGLYGGMDQDTMARTVRRDLTRLVGIGSLERQTGGGRKAAAWRRTAAKAAKEEKS